MAALSVRYAVALLEICQERGALDESLEQAELLLTALKSQECQGILNHPFVGKKEKDAFLTDVFGQSIHKDLLNFLFLAVEKNRTEFIVPALEAFIDMGNSFRGKTEANVVSATPLTKEQLDQIREMLIRKLDKQVEIHASTNPALIGGLYIHVDGYLIDHTVRKQLNDMRDSLKRRSGGYDSQAR